MAASSAPKLLVTIDTEADDQWTRRPETSTENVRRLPHLQETFDRHGVRPTYLVSYAVACDPRAVDILGRFSEQGKCEIGAHLHPWNTPPDFRIQGEAWESHPFLYQYPPDVQRRKFETLHTKLTDVFGLEPKSYRAGRYGLDPHGVGLLREFRYRVDSSVTPTILWSDYIEPGAPAPDFRRAPLGVYELSEEDVCVPGHSGVLEVPVSVGYTRRMPRVVLDWLKRRSVKNPAVRAFAAAFRVRKRWFRPRIDVSINEVESAARWLLDRGVGFLNMMFHSSELVPNSQWCATENEVEAFLERIEEMLRLAERLGCERGTTVSEFAAGNSSENL